MTMNTAKKLAQDALEANRKLMEFFEPHIERKATYMLELNDLTEEEFRYVNDVTFNYEDSTEDLFVFSAEVDEGYYGTLFVHLAFDSDFVNDPEDAKLRHEAELEARRQQIRDIETRRIEAEILGAQREVDRLRAKLLAEKEK